MTILHYADTELFFMCVFDMVKKVQLFISGNACLKKNNFPFYFAIV